MATFYACKQFYDKTPKDKLDPILAQYDKYMNEVRAKMKKRRQEDKGTLKRLQQQHPDDDIDILKGALFKTYVSDYPEAQYHDNPYENLDDSDNEEDFTETTE